jgi:hypothetical protein
MSVFLILGLVLSCVLSHWQSYCPNANHSDLIAASVTKYVTRTKQITDAKTSSFLHPYLYFSANCYSICTSDVQPHVMSFELIERVAASFTYKLPFSQILSSASCSTTNWGSFMLKSKNRIYVCK